MSIVRLTQTQTGALFGILASVLIFVLTAMALESMNGRPPHHGDISADFAAQNGGLSG